jgi:hypothetical protein
LWPKPKNRHDDFKAQITKHSCRFQGSNWKTIATCFEPKPEETVTTGFDVKPEKTVPVVLRSNH